MWARYPEYNRTYATGTGGRHLCDLLVPASAAAVDTVMWNLLADADPVPERKAAAMAFAKQQLWATDTDRIGNASGAVPPFPVLRLIGKSAFVTRPKLLDYTVDRKELLMRSNEIFGWLGSGELNVSIDKYFDLDNAPEGHKYLESGASKGKVLFKC